MIATYNSDLHATLLQRCKLQRMQPESGLKMRGFSNGAETLQLVPTIATYTQRRCNILSLLISLTDGLTRILICLGITGCHPMQNLIINDYP